MYKHPEVDRVWILNKEYMMVHKDHILSTPGWMYEDHGRTGDGRRVFLYPQSTSIKGLLVSVRF